MQSQNLCDSRLVAVLVIWLSLLMYVSVYGCCRRRVVLGDVYNVSGEVEKSATIKDLKVEK